MSARKPDAIQISGARQHNLKEIDVAIPLGQITAITGVSGSGKSSLAFDTLYAEGQRRYVESFSPYARQFMDRMDRPDVDQVSGVLPAVAIDQKNAIKASRSTVGTVTELTDFIKLLYAQVGVLHCGGCGEVVDSDEPTTVADRLLHDHQGQRALITFAVAACRTIKATRLGLEWLQSEGYRRLRHDGTVLSLDEDSVAQLSRQLKTETYDVIADRLTISSARRARLVDSLEAAMSRGGGRVGVWLDIGEETARGQMILERFSRGRHCAACDRSYPEPVSNHFSYNSPLGACERCNGFGAVIDLDLDLVIPDSRLSLAEGAIRPWNTDRTSRDRSKLLAYCRRVGIPTDVPWRELDDTQREQVVEGDRAERWRGIRGWFRWLERRTYKMHVRVFLSRYRAYRRCPDCDGTRLAPHALLYRLAGVNLGELYARSLGQARRFFDELRLPPQSAQASEGVLREVRSRLRYLCEVGVDYLTLNRQSRTLSGGEVQRVNLTTAIGSALVNTLYVLDEPSVGLHPRDNERLLEILERLRANRNTIVVVEHDEAIIARCDRIVDIGPGPGAAGGQVVFEGRPAELARAKKRSVTARFMTERAHAPTSARRPVNKGHPSLVVRGASQHNLRHIDVAFPLGRLTAVTGVSGSGKSTLIEEVLYRGLQRQRGQPTDPPGSCTAIEGADQLREVMLVDQSPIGTTPRSNPATYVKAFDPIRKLFAAQPRAQQRGLAPGAFSFNVAGGRCEACEGNGFERIEMQFLSDCFVACESCGGKRFKPEVLAVTVRGRSIHDVLEMTVEQARDFFVEQPEIVAPLGALSNVGLGYLRLGQPLNTLSGGESQRLKLASHLVLQRSEQSLLLLDEPTVGLHLSDVAGLIDNLQQLVELGNTVVVIEHHVDLIAAADWVVDLGPEGGEQGGGLVVVGTPRQVARHAQSHTGRYLAEHLTGGSRAADGRNKRSPRLLAPADMVVRGARVHNLANIDARLPRGALVVISGPSGSGKSSLAFDVLYAEGQRRFIDCLSPYARQYVAQVARPDLDELLGVPPTVCISQRTSRGGYKSTVATMTEIYHYLRLIYARIGKQHCTSCGAVVEALQPEELAKQILAKHAKQEIVLLAPVVRGRKGYHKQIFARAIKEGHAQIRVDGRLRKLKPRSKNKTKPAVPKLSRYREHDIEYVIAQIVIDATNKRRLVDAVERALELGGGTLVIAEVSEEEEHPEQTYSQQRFCADCGIGFRPLDPRAFSFNSSAGACRSCGGTGIAGGDPTAPPRTTRKVRGRRGNRAKAPKKASKKTAAKQERRQASACTACDGTRLCPEARAVRLGDLSIDQLTALTAPAIRKFLKRLSLSQREQKIASGALAEIDARCAFLDRVGLSYLSLDRGAPTLSGGEAQRVRLAAQLSADLRGVLYVLDEPTIGLHPVDNDRLLATLRQLVERGNSVLVVEHDESTIRQADHLFELGPGGGTRGGNVIASGPVDEVLGREESPTGQSLRQSGKQRALFRNRCRGGKQASIVIKKARRHNLQSIDVSVPLGCFTVVTGVSGSGKSSLVRDVLGEGVRRLEQNEEALWCDAIEGAAQIRRVREIDQRPIGKTPASTPATYVGLFNDLRRLFSGLPESRVRGYKPGRFSFNVKGGRCEHCKGQGQVRHEMSFLPDVYARCDVCAAGRYNPETLQIRYRGLSVADVLRQTVAEARETFSAVPSIRRALDLLCDVGLDYLQLGQPSNTLSGGEAQRIKLVEELQKEGGQGTLYIMDEPSTGLHWVDLRRLLEVMQRLVDRGDTLVVVEHNLDVIASADWIIDLGPGGGEQGGRLLHQGSRPTLLRKRSATARYLKQHLSS